MRLLGRFGSEINVALASDFGMKFGSFASQPFIVGSDARFGSLPIKMAFISGVLSSGCNVADVGYVPAPIVARIAREEKVWGVHVSSDPYPKDYVGVRIYDPAGKPWNGNLSAKSREGAVGRLAELDLTPNYIGEVMAKYDVEPMKVVIDSANGPTGNVAPALLRSLGTEVMEINSSLSPIPSREYEPTLGNLRDLEFIVHKKRADLGIAFDGAGNKAGFIVPGGYISSSRAMAILMKFNGYDRAVADFGATSVLDLVGTVERVPASEVAIAEKLQSKGFEMGGGTSGVAFSEWSLAPDAIILMMELMETSAKKGKSINELNMELPESHEDAEMVRVKDVDEAMKASGAHFKNEEVDTRDGLKVVFEDGWLWLKQMRGFVRVFAESESRQRVFELIEEGKKSIKRFA
jgi:phosphomannomutase/phosphoglucomutase